MADATLELIDEGFASETEPSGKAWEPKVFPDGRKILQGSTGKLRKGWRKKQVTASGFEVANVLDPENAKRHQRGTGIFGPKHRRIFPKRAGMLRWPVPGGVMFARSVAGAPARKMIPDRGFMPSSWRKRLARRAQLRLREIFARG